MTPNHRHRVYWKRATASEPANYTWSWTTSTYASGAILAYINAEQDSDPIHASSFNASAVAGTAAQATSITTSTAACLLLYLNTHNTASTVIPPAGMGENADVQEMEEANRAQAATGATGNKTGTISASSGWGASLVALLPETGAPPAVQAPLRRVVILP